MNHTLYYALCFGGAFSLAAALTPAAISLGRRAGIMDVPDARKVHTSPVPRVGGLAMAAAFIAVATPAMAYAYVQGEIIPPALIFPLATLAAISLLVLLVGVVDDVRPLPAKFKACALAAAAAAFCAAGGTIDGLVVSTGQTVLDLAAISWVITIFWIVGMTTSVNFIDGLDGLAGGFVAIGAATLAVVCMLHGSVAITLPPLCLLAVVLGFLIFNWHPAKVFMGDSGSMFIGFTLAASSVLAAPRIGTMQAFVLPTLALSVPILDTAVTLFRRRFIQRRSIFSAERGHIHHRLMEIGLSHPKAVLVLLGTSLLAVGIGQLSMLAKGLATFGVLSLVIPLLLGLFRGAGSVRSRDIIMAIRRKRSLDRDRGRFASAFEELQLLFRATPDFATWWQNVCTAATKLDFALVELAVPNRDGSIRTLRWTPAEEEFTPGERLKANVPVRERRKHEPLQAIVEVPASGSLESAGHRLALFSRLMAEHSVASLPGGTPARGRGEDDAADRWQSLSTISGWDRISPRQRRQRRRSRERAAGEANALLNPPRTDGSPRVAIVHDFLYVYAGAERVLEQMIDAFPDADLFSLFDFVPEGERGFLRGKPVTTSFIQRLPLARKKHRAYLPLMPLAIEQLDVSGYDIVLSSSYLAAKGVITGPDQLHVCYCHSPVRYAWDLQHQYLAQSNMRWSPRAILARSILHYIRNWDVRSATGVDTFIANSHFVARRIEKVYRRKATVIHPPVDVSVFETGTQREEFFVTASRHVPYKRIDLIVETFNQMPDRKLIVIGDGPETPRLREMAGPNVRFVGHQPHHRLAKYLQLAKAFVFAAEEDFGIAPVEAMACGTPVIAYGRGGVTESVIEGQTGVFFHEQTPTSLVDAVRRFDLAAGAFDAAAIRGRAETFAAETFRRELSRVVAARYAAARRDRGQAVTDAPDGAPDRIDTPLAAAALAGVTP